MGSNMEFKAYSPSAGAALHTQKRTQSAHNARTHANKHARGTGTAMKNFASRSAEGLVVWRSDGEYRQWLLTGTQKTSS